MEDEERLMQRVKPDLDADFLRKYVAYAKRNVFPVLTEEALDSIKQYYVNLRNSGDGSIPFTARQLEAFVRLAEASARIRLSQEANLEDAQRGIRIVESYLRSVGVDRETGKFDIDVIATGVSHSQHDRMRILLDLVRTLAKNDKGYASEDDIVREASKQGISPDLARKSLETMHRNGSIFAKGGAGKYAPLSG
jgi:replicative DNA helicase Mcm